MAYRAVPSYNRNTSLDVRVVEASIIFVLLLSVLCPSLDGRLLTISLCEN